MKINKFFAAGLLLFVSVSASATTALVVGNVETLFHVDDDNFGGCMVKLSSQPQSQGLNCPSWITFSCSGQLTSKDNAYRMYDMAQMAMALGNSVSVWLNDEKKHNGYCFVEGIYINQAQ